MSSGRGLEAVFLSPSDGGPIRVKDTHQIPGWSDPRRPGNFNVNLTASEIMSSWDEDTVRSFHHFLSQALGSKNLSTQWVQDTTDNQQKQNWQIFECKLELIKRLALIGIHGPLSLEDWCLYYLYKSGKIRIPTNFRDLLYPDNQSVDIDDYTKQPVQFDDRFKVNF